MTYIPAIPGAGVLGWGFDVFGSYSSRSKTRQMFPMTTGDDRQWTFGPSGQSYLLPDNTAVEEVAQGSGTSRVFKDRTEVESHFAAKAKVTGSYGFFSGEFEASYGQTSRSDSEYTFSMFFSDYHTWRLALKDREARALADWVKADPDFQEIPSTFDDGTKALFYRFFDKYGTHFVSSVLVGYRLYYSSAVEKSHTSNEQEISTKLKLEYNALFVKGGAEAEAEWNRVGKEWTENRVASVSTVGGDSSPLDAVAPGYGDNYAATFKAWREKAERFPAAVDFELSPMWGFFSGAQAEAMQEAFEAYARDRVYVESKSDGSTIVVRGVVERPDEPPIQRGSGFQVAVLDRATLKPVANRYVMFAWGDAIWNRWQAVYDELESLLASYCDSRYLLVIAARGMLQSWSPPESVYQQLLTLGASSNLRGWLDFIAESGSPYPQPLNYILVGVPGRGVGSGSEALSRGDNNVYFYEYDGTWVWSGKTAPMVTVTVSLRQLLLEGEPTLHEPVLLRMRGDEALEALRGAA